MNGVIKNEAVRRAEKENTEPLCL